MAARQFQSGVTQFLARHSPLVILAGLCIVLAVISEDFRSPANLQRVAVRTAVIGVLAAGQILVILTAGIDLSIGSVAAFAGVVGALAMKDSTLPEGLAVTVGMVCGCGAGLACGFVNGVVATKGRIPPFIVTLGMMMVARGLALMVSGSLPVSGLPETFHTLGDGMAPVIVLLGVVAIVSIVLAWTRFGRALYATGGNTSGARLSGIPVDRVRIAAFSLSGLCAGLGGMLLAARTTQAMPTAAEMYELDAIAACVIGGTSLMGGEGTGPGVLAGALIMNVLVNFCNLMGINVHWQRILVGSLLVGLVYYDNFRKRRAGLMKEL